MFTVPCILENRKTTNILAVDREIPIRRSNEAPLVVKIIKTLKRNKRPSHSVKIVGKLH